ncbi:MAG: hypothetical protein ACLSWZ_01180 [Parabacteroides distasonis]|uniref:hypothetical protein n=1 Tax=Parabacteroides distasonis TaxID=823 RepID=UPI0020121851|nr:hypothetical protein [Parabacteroides distasonis]
MVADGVAAVVSCCAVQPFDCLCGKVETDCPESLRLSERICFLVSRVFSHHSGRDKGTGWRSDLQRLRRNTVNESFLVRQGFIRRPVLFDFNSSLRS